jgi:hypothetical protein
MKNTEVVNKIQKLQPPTPSEKIHWLRNSKAKLEINNDLSHQKGFECDSVIGIDYIGFENEDFYYPINNKGEFISTIKKKQKLNNEQFSNLNSILGNRKTYEHPQIIGCYEPRLGFIYYKENKVIGETQICLSCAQLHSTARTVGKEYGNSINDEARKKIDNLRIELGFSNGYK